MTADPNSGGTSTSVGSKFVLEYLRSRGYRRAEAALLEEQERARSNAESGAPSARNLAEEAAIDDAEVDDDLRNVFIPLLNSGQLSGEADAHRYEESYCALRDWVDGSLDLYKAELHSVLYPLLVHCFLEMVRREFPDQARSFLSHCSNEFSEDVGASAATPGRKAELVALSGISSKQHLEENESARLFLSNRYELHLSSYAFELIVSFLVDDPRRIVLLRILNQRCRVLVDAAAGTANRAGFPGPKRDETTSDGFLSIRERTSYIQEHEVLWGRLTPDLFLKSDEEGGATEQGAQIRGSTSHGPAASGNATVGNLAGGAPGDAAMDDRSGGDPVVGSRRVGLLDKVNTDAKDSTVEEIGEEPPHVRPDGTLSESRIPLKRYRIGSQGLETEEDRRARAPLGSRPVPVPMEIVSVAEVDVGGEADSQGLPPVAALEEDASTFVLPSVLCYTFTNMRGDGLNCSAVSQDGSQIAAGFGDSSIRLWDGKATGTAGQGAGGFGNQAIRLIGHSGPVYSVDWTGCSRFVLSGSEDGTVRLWSAMTRTDLVAYRGHNYPVWSVGFAPLGHYFASGSHDRTARVWVTDRVYPLRIMAGHLADVDTVRWHPNCNYLATGSSDRTARLWDVRDGRCVRVFGLQGGAVQSLAFSPDGRTLAVAGQGRDVEVWDISEGRLLSRLSGHTRAVWSMDFSRDGSVLASGGGDSTVRLWRTDDWSCAIAGSGGGDGSGIGGAAAAQPGLTAGAAATSSLASTAVVGGLGMAPGSTVLGKRRSGHGKNKQGGSIAMDGLSTSACKSSADMSKSSSALVTTLRARQTPIHLVQFTRRNLLIAAGNFSP
jgi:transcription initiation factor TFIID subunit 5